MACEIRSTTAPSLSGLVSGILHDAQELIHQEIALARVEIGGELRKTKAAALSMVAGLAVLAVGSLFLLLAIVFLISWATSDNVPLWGSFLIVGGILAAAGAALVFMGRARAEQINLVPRQTYDTLRENLQWMKNPR
jgi:uncharacterized membrane protein YqjE